MTMIAQTMTAEELLRMPEDGFGHELVRGELRKMSPAGNKHGRIAALLTGSLVQHVLARKLGAVYTAEAGFKLSSDPDTVRAPDVAFVSQQQLDEVGDVEGFWPGPPDLAVEVISPNDNYTEVEAKVCDYLAAGTRMVIVVNPRQRTLTVHRSLLDIRVLQEGDTLDAADAVPGWQLAVAELFAQ